MMELLQGDCLTMLATLPAQSVQTCVTSPPYYGLRDYGHDGQIGLEETPAEYVAKLVEVFRQVKRVLRDDGCVWLNLGDSYSAGGNGPGSKHYQENCAGMGTAAARALPRKSAPDGYKPKDLLGIPWRVAFALQADGWYLRSDIIWHKPNPMPESVTDRPTKSHEYIFLLSKSERYFYDAEAVKERSVSDHPSGNGFKRAARLSYLDSNGPRGNEQQWQVTPTRNRRTVWTVSTKPFSGAHFATFPPDLIEPCILAGTSAKGCCPECGKGWERVVERPFVGEKTFAGSNGQQVHKPGVSHDLYALPSVTTGWQQACDCPAAEPVPCVVLDPFAGAGTTGVVSVKHGRAFVGVELNPDYWQMAKDRIEAEIARPKQLGLAI